jgi:hypothetical protein
MTSRETFYSNIQYMTETADNLLSADLYSMLPDNMLSADNISDNLITCYLRIAIFYLITPSYQLVIVIR